MSGTNNELTKKMSPEKRREYQNRKKRVEQRRKILGSVIIFLIIVMTALFLMFKVLFKINTIQINGKSPYDETQVINASGVLKGESLLACNKEKISYNITKNLPYINSALIKRKLPSTLVIEVKSTSAFIALPTVSGTAIADKDGKVLEIASADKIKGEIIKLDAGVSFPAKIGEIIFDALIDNEQSKQLQDKEKVLKTLLEAINTSGIKDIRSIDIKSTSNIYMVYQDRFKLNIGSVSDIEYKLKAAVQIIANENKAVPNEKGEIFLSNPDNIYVTPESN